MNIKDLQAGMVIKLADSIEESIKKLGGGSIKRSFGGKVLEIENVIKEKDAVRASGWRFLVSDIVEIFNQHFPDSEAEDFIFENLDEVKEGMSIRLAPNVEFSIKKFGGGKTKRSLKGSIRVIQRLRKDKNAVEVKDDRGSNWTFVLGDLRRVIPKKTRKKSKKETLFDPTQLDL